LARGPLDFAYPAYPIVTYLVQSYNIYIQYL